MSDSDESILRPVVEAVAAEVQKALSDGAIHAENLQVYRWQVEKFEYSDEGLNLGTGSCTQVSKPSWAASYRFLQPRVASCPGYKKALDNLSARNPEQAAVQGGVLDSFIARLVGMILSEDDGPKINVTKAKALWDRFLSELDGGPITYRAKINLTGLTLRPTSIQAAFGVTLRRPVREDVEVELSPLANFGSPFPIAPQAVAEIQYIGAKNQNVDLQREVEHVIAALRLFGVGSVSYTSYDMESDSMMGPFSGARASMHSGTRVTARERYLIKAEDEGRLKAFWQAVAHAMPRDIYDFQKQVSPLTLAYDRYSDAVLNNGVVERRIANAIMGLEALLLDENQELSYRLGARIAKLLSFVGQRSLEVRQRIRDAYKIRSTFAHGGHLSHKEKAKIERHYGSLPGFTQPLFNYLRIVIVLMIALNSEKEQIIDWLDDALIDAARHESLRAKLEPLASLVAAPL
jgi:hypothetical protein